jgi:hypothetical protein
MLERALYRTPRPRRQRASARRYFRNGHRAAVVRATTGARLYLDGRVPSLAAAAEACGSNIFYVRSAIVLLKAADPSLLKSAMAGLVSLPAAANQERRRRKAARVTVDEVVQTWRAWTPEQRAEFGRGAGVANLWDDAIVPTSAEDRTSQVAAE